VDGVVFSVGEVFFACWHPLLNKTTAVAKSASKPAVAAVIDAGGRVMTRVFIATLTLVGQMSRQAGIRSSQDGGLAAI